MKFRYVGDRTELIRTIPKLEVSPLLYLDTETTADKVRLIQVGNEEEIFIFDLFEIPSAVEPLKEILSKKGIIGHNLKFDLKFLLPMGFSFHAVFDTMIASYLLGFERHSLNHLCEILLGKSLDKSLQLSDWASPTLTKQQLEYAAADVWVLKELFPILREKLNDLPDPKRGQELLKTRTAKIFGITNPAVIVEMAFVQEVAKLELSGLPVDQEEIDRLLREYERRKNKLVMDFMVKYRVDPLSTKQLGNFLKNRLGLDLPLTEKGNVATDDRSLAEFAHVPAVREVLEIRRIKKASDKLRELKELIRNGRVYPEFKQIGAVTGRMSSSKPNVQNVPRDMRSLFRAQEGRLFVIADFSQIELRIAAEYVGDENMIKAFKEGKDLHRYTASLVLEKSEADVTKEERQLAKALNFGLIYGISAKGLAEYARSSYGVDIDLESASVFRKKFFIHFPAFREWHDRVKEELKKEGEIRGQTLLGRPYRASSFTDAVNYPVQGTGADLLKLAVLMFEVELRKKGLSANLVNLVHDEIVVECPQEQAKEVKETLENAMTKAGHIVLKEVPTEVESLVDKSWAKG